jgi:hypothetical protein
VFLSSPVEDDYLSLCVGADLAVYHTSEQNANLYARKAAQQRTDRFAIHTRASVLFAAAPFAGAIISFIIFRNTPSLNFLLSVPLMIFGTFILFKEAHEHLHQHGSVDHEHTHRHDDEHHEHKHENEVQKDITHCHRHHHDNIVHFHNHMPDTHHRHNLS